MASFVYDSFLDDVFKGNIDCDTDTFKCALLTSTYTPNRATHVKRSDLTNEVAAGGGYTAGGAACTVTVSKNTSTHVNTVTLGAVSWGSASFTARYGAVYKSRGGASSADELVALIDFAADKTASGGTFQLTASTYDVTNT